MPRCTLRNRTPSNRAADRSSAPRELAACGKRAAWDFALGSPHMLRHKRARHHPSLMFGLGPPDAYRLRYDGLVLLALLAVRANHARRQVPGLVDRIDRVQNPMV